MRISKLISFSEKQNEYLVKQAKDKGVTFTEMVRRILDEHINDYEKQVKKGEKQKE